MLATPRVSLSIRDNDTTDIFTWSAAAHPSLSARVNGVRVWSAPGQPFQLALEKSKLPFLSFQLPAGANETIAIHVDLQALTGGLAAKRKREEEDAPNPLPKKQRTDTVADDTAPSTRAPPLLTDEQKEEARLRKRQRDREYRDRKRKEKEQLATPMNADPDVDM